MLERPSCTSATATVGALTAGLLLGLLAGVLAGLLRAPRTTARGRH